MLRFEIDPAKAALVMALSAAGLLVGALIIEHALGAEPCRLCIWQRYPHLALIVLGIVGFIAWPKAALVAGGLVALGSAALALYHVGIEQGYWALPAGCVVGSDARTIDELRQALLEERPSCDQVSFTLLGLSLSLWNAIASLVLAMLPVLAMARAFGPETQPVE